METFTIKCLVNPIKFRILEEIKYNMSIVDVGYYTKNSYKKNDAIHQQRARKEL